MLGRRRGSVPGDGVAHDDGGRHDDVAGREVLGRGGRRVGVTAVAGGAWLLGVYVLDVQEGPTRTSAAAAYSSALARAAATARRRASTRSSRLAVTSKSTASIWLAPAATRSRSSGSTSSKALASTANAAWH